MVPPIPSGVVNPVLSIAGSALKRSWVWLKKAVFWFRDRRPLLPPADAERRAAAVIPGSVVLSQAFRNRESKHHYLAAITKPNDQDTWFRVRILENVGGTYVQIWTSDDLSGLNVESLALKDIDKDGWKEMIFEAESWGSGAGSRTLYCYSIPRKQLYSIEEFHHYAVASLPGPSISIDGGDDPNFREAFIAEAVSRGYLKATDPPDYESPRFAILRWHKENGGRRAGQISIHFYPGQPDCDASIVTELEADGYLWRSYFKGPLVAIDCSTNQHFIAYSPEWVYEWVTSLASVENVIWFTCHSAPGVFSFSLIDRRITHYCAYGGLPLPSEPEIIRAGESLILRNQLIGEEVLVKDLRRLQPCWDFCMRAEPHTRDQCSAERYREGEPETSNRTPS